MDSNLKRSYIPIMLDAKSLNWLVIGGGNIATRKIETLVAQGVTSITVVAPVASPSIKQLAEQKLLTVIEATYQMSYMSEQHVVYAATDDIVVNRQVCRDAKLHDVLVCNVSEQEMGNFISPAFFKRDNILFSVSAQGKSPIVTKILADEWAKQVDERFIAALPLLDQLRHDLKRDIEHAPVRQQLLRDATAAILHGKVEHYNEWYQSLLKNNR